MKNRVSQRVPWGGTGRVALQVRNVATLGLTPLSQKGTQSWSFIPLLSKETRLPAFKAVVQGAPRFYITHVVPPVPARSSSRIPTTALSLTGPGQVLTGAGATVAALSEPGWDAVRGVWEVAFLFSCQCSLEKPALQSLPLMCSRQEAAFVIRCQSECFLALSIDFRGWGQNLQRRGTWLHSLMEHTGSVGWEGTLGALVST